MVDEKQELKKTISDIDKIKEKINFLKQKKDENYLKLQETNKNN